MRTSTVNGLTLFEWSKLMGLNPWEVSQVGEGFPEEYHTQFSCSNVWFQENWQADRLGREELAMAIASAEESISMELGYWPSPRYFEQTAVPISFNRQWYNSNHIMNGRSRIYNLDHKKVQGAGILARTSIDPAAAIVYSDEDGDGIEEKFTITVATTATAIPSEIGIYFTSTDRLGDDIGEQWRIRPIKVKFTGGNVVITGHKCLMVLPVETEGYTPLALNVTNAANFATEVELYRVYKDDTATEANPNQGYALWNPIYGDCVDLPCVQTAEPVCVSEVFSDQGQVSISFPVSCCPNWRQPDALRIKYLAGEPTDIQGNMSRIMADSVAKLACSLLPMSNCGCDRTDRIINWWRDFPNADEKESKGRLVTFDEIYAPFGERRGAIYAWKRIRRLKELGHGIA